MWVNLKWRLFRHIENQYGKNLRQKVVALSLYLQDSNGNDRCKILLIYSAVVSDKKKLEQNQFYYSIYIITYFVGGVNKT